MQRMLTVALVLVIVVYGVATAESQFLSPFVNFYSIPNSSKLNSCTTCHTGGSKLNSYGDCLAGNGAASNLTNALQACEDVDSDGDGISNLQEIQAGTWPGDPGDFSPVAEQTWGAIKSLYEVRM